MSASMKSFFACFCAALLALSAAPSPAAAQQTEPPAPRVFGDWTGLCVAGGYCSLSAFADQNGPMRPGLGVEPAYRLSLLRRPGWSQDDLIFTPLGGNLQSGSSFEIRVDGAPGALLGPADGWQILEDGAPNEAQIAPSLFQIGLFPRMKAGSSLTVDFIGDDGRPRRARFSLNGLSSGADWLARPR